MRRIPAFVPGLGNVEFVPKDGGRLEPSERAELPTTLEHAIAVCRSHGYVVRAQ
jgi:hypothetical protein